jgi:hypothetical protein
MILDPSGYRPVTGSTALALSNYLEPIIELEPHSLEKIPCKAFRHEKKNIGTNTGSFCRTRLLLRLPATGV